MSILYLTILCLPIEPICICMSMFFSFPRRRENFSVHCQFHREERDSTKNAVNIYIHHRQKQLPTTTKAVVNYVLDSTIKDNHCEACKLFLDNRYACSELLSRLFEDTNIIGGSTCRNNIIVFP